MAVALIVAAGRGERLGFERPKALVPLAGRPMLEWSVAVLRELAEVEAIVVALPAAALGEAPGGVLAVPGGEVRSASVRAALRACPPGDPVIVHDAARPLASAELFRRSLRELEATGAAGVIAAAPVSDTIKEEGESPGMVARTLRRDRLWAVQTPQVFRREPLTAALEGASPEDLRAATDDAWLLERQGNEIRLCPSSPRNLKITTELDLRVAEMVLGERTRGAA